MKRGVELKLFEEDYLTKNPFYLEIKVGSGFQSVKLFGVFLSFLNGHALKVTNV